MAAGKIKGVHRVKKKGKVYKYLTSNRCPLPSGIPENSQEFLEAYRRAKAAHEEDQKARTAAAEAQTRRYDWCRRSSARCKNRSQKRGLNADITAEMLEEMLIEQQQVCAVSGMPLAFSPGRARDPYLASVDRIDNSRGYETGNIRIVCALVNYALNTYDDKTLEAFATAIHRRKLRQLRSRRETNL